MSMPTIQPSRIFRLRPEQLEHLHHESFPRKLRRSLRKVWPEQTAASSEEALHERIETTITRAKAHGIENRDNIARFVHLTFLLGRQDFDEAPETQWAAIILGWEMDETKKLDALEKRAAIEQEKAMTTNARPTAAADPPMSADDRQPPTPDEPFGKLE